jgi:hypothetical protein
MDFTQWAVAQVERELAEAAERERAGRLAPGEGRNGNSVSTVFSVRLDRRERAALEARAEACGVKPSVLARNYIRVGLTRPEMDALDALDRIDAAVAQIRAAAQAL